MVGRLVKFLTQLKGSHVNALKKCSSKDSCFLNIVCGNESADLDSIVSTIAYAYLSFLNDPSALLLPVINIPKEDLKLRRDVCYLLDSHSISSDLLYFKEDLRNWSKLPSCDINCVLVDHNDIPHTNKDVLLNVVGIVDHHKDVGLHTESVETFSGPRIIQTAGSCSSLVFDYWFKILKSNEQACAAIKGVVPLLLGALLIDTDDMKHKVEHIDTVALEEYKKLSQESVDTNRLYQKLREAKDDINGLYFHDILRKDYKEFNFNPETRCGIASVVKSIQWIERRFDKANIESTCTKYIEENSLDILVLMTSFTENDIFSKQIAFQINPNRDPQLLKSLVNDLAPKLDLVKIESLSSKCFECYDQKNTKMSRKQVAPFIEEFIHK